MAQSKHREAWVKRRLRPFVVLAGSAYMILVIPLLATFLKNKYEVSVQDLVLPLLVDAITAMIITAFAWRRYRRAPFEGYFFTILLSIVLATGYNNRLSEIYPLFQAILPVSGLEAFEGPLFSLVFISLLVGLSGLAARLIAGFVTRRGWKSTEVMKALMVAVTVTFIFQLIPLVKTLVIAWPQYFYKPPKLASTAKTTTDKPDIYYIVLDRYASQTVLKEQMGYDNQDFLNFLGDSGYYVNPDAHQNYPYTTMSIASTLNADYHDELVKQFAKASSQSIVPYHRSIQYSSVVTELKSLGYSYDQIGTWYEATDQGPQADHFYLKDGQLTLFNHTWSLNNFTKNDLQQGPYWRFINAGIKLGNFKIASYQAQAQVDMTDYQLDTLNQLAGEKSGGRFIFAHMLIPHDPYYFNADGSLSTAPYSDNNGQPVKQKYVGQVKYINSEMKSLLKKINDQSDGKAVVVLQSDEGPYPMQLNDEVFDQGDVDSEINDLDMRAWSDANLKMKYGNLAAYHIPAASAEALVQGGDNVNIFRLVLNTYFSDSLPYLDECYYAYSDGRRHPFVYSDITKRLSPNSGATCSANGSGPKS